MLPRPTVDRIVQDVEGILLSAESDFEGKGLRMPSMLRALLRALFTRAYQAGVDAQREVITLELETTPEGRAILQRSNVTRPRQLP